jgi:lipopolysaccharide export system protein LptC
VTVQERHSVSDVYAPRRLSALGHGYSVFVRILKFVLPLAMLVIIGVLIARLSGDPQQQKITALPQAEKTTPGQIELIRAKYEGTDDQGRAYAVTADKTIRAMDAPDTVLFEKPLADITLQDKTWIAIKAETGSFDHAAEKLELKGNVTIFHDSGYELSLQDITIDLKQKTAATSLPVRAQGPLGTIAAKDMSVKDRGDLVVFGGPITLTIFKLSPGGKHG